MEKERQEEIMKWARLNGTFMDEDSVYDRGRFLHTLTEGEKEYFFDLITTGGISHQIDSQNDR